MKLNCNLNHMKKRNNTRKPKLLIIGFCFVNFLLFFFKKSPLWPKKIQLADSNAFSFVDRTVAFTSFSFLSFFFLLFVWLSFHFSHTPRSRLKISISKISHTLSLSRHTKRKKRNLLQTQHLMHGSTISIFSTFSTLNFPIFFNDFTIVFIYYLANYELFLLC